MSRSVDATSSSRRPWKSPAASVGGRERLLRALDAAMRISSQPNPAGRVQGASPPLRGCEGPALNQECIDLEVTSSHRSTAVTWRTAFSSDLTEISDEWWRKSGTTNDRRCDEVAPHRTFITNPSRGRL